MLFPCAYAFSFSFLSMFFLHVPIYVLFSSVLHEKNSDLHGRISYSRLPLEFFLVHAFIIFYTVFSGEI